MNQDVCDLLDLLLQKRMNIFCGAGISMLPPSNAPSWWDIYAAAGKALHIRLLDGFPELGPLVNMDDILAPSLSTQRLADLTIHRFASRDFLKILRAVDVADANENHRAVAVLAAAGFLRGVVTTNYDTLLERAAVAKGLNFVVASPGTHPNRRAGSPFIVIKLHGTVIDPPNIIESTFDKAQEISPLLLQAWRPLINGSGLLVVGYSGADLDFGAAKAFFDDHLKVGNRIWWLHRPGSRPRLPPAIAARASLIEGQLPDLLRYIVTESGNSDFSVPLSGRDSRTALAEAVDEWSMQPNIGRWGAATFFLGLCQSSPSRSHNLGLRQALLKIANEQSSRIVTAQRLSLDDASSTNFLAEAALVFVEISDLESANQAMLASLTLSNSLSVANENQIEENVSASNLVSALGNFALGRLLDGGKAEASPVLFKALGLAYLEGDRAGFACTLANILAYILELSDVRRCMHLAEAGAELADRVGAVDVSIHFRSLLAMYACDRNEVWSARKWLIEAQQLSISAARTADLAILTMQLGECLIRTGEIVDGLLLIAQTTKDDTIYFNRPIEETRRYLQTLGVTQKGPFTLTLSPTDVPSIAARIAADLTAARTPGDRRWAGERCAISPTACIGREDGRALVQIGIHELSREGSAAADIGAGLGQYLLGLTEYRDARCVARNVMLNPSTSTAGLATSTAAFAYANAALGRIGEAREAFIACELYYRRAAIQMPFSVASSGLWFFIQSRDLKGRALWADLAVLSAKSEPDGATKIASLMKDVETWGADCSDVTAILCRYPRVEKNPVVNELNPHAHASAFRLFKGEHGMSNASARKAMTTLSDAIQLANAGSRKDALQTLDKLAAMSGLPERVVGAAIAVQLEVLAPSLTLAQLDQAVLMRRREMVPAMAFSALSCLERAFSRIVMMTEGPRRVSKSLLKRGWIAIFSEDVAASACLLAWYAQARVLVGDFVPKTTLMEEYVQLPEYFGFGEPEIATLGAASSLPSDDTAQSEVSDDLEALSTGLTSTDDPLIAFQIVAGKVATLRFERKLTPRGLAGLREELAMWYLQKKKYHEAIIQFRRMQTTYRCVGELPGELHALAGEARAQGRSGNYSEAVQVFERAIAKADGSYVPVAPSSLADLLLGLAAAHLHEALRNRPSIDGKLIERSIETLQHVLVLAPPDSRVRAFGRLMLARAYGESQQQGKALETLDVAISELSHLGSEYAKLLAEHRGQFVDGAWHTLELE